MRKGGAFLKSGPRTTKFVCVTRVGKVLSTSSGKAMVELFDSKEVAHVDVSLLRRVSKGTYVEVFGNLALSQLTPAQARTRKQAWREVRRAALMSEA